MTKELTAEQVRPWCDPAAFHCNSTEQIEPIKGIIGQDRAISALEFGLNIRKQGFNIFVAGVAGTGKTTAIKPYLESLAAKKDTPPDWCYVNNFRDPYHPKALQLPAGMGQELQKDMTRLIENARRSIEQAFASKEYAARRGEVTEQFSKQREAIFERLRSKAEEQGFRLQSTPFGVVFVPLVDGRPMTEEEYGKLSKENRNELEKIRERLTKELQEQVARLRSQEREVQQQLEATDKDVARYAIGHLFEELKNKYKKLPQVVEYLKEVEQDMVDNFGQFRTEQQTDSNPLAAMQGMLREHTLRQYQINVLVDNSDLKGAPVVVEFNPTFQNLVGRIEKEAQFGALSTDFTLIRSGSLHRANGGYLVVRIEDVMSNFESWQALKRALRDGKLVIEEVGERFGFMATKSLRPEPVPLDIKVVVIGEPIFYYLLWRMDLEFKELFKVKADFDTRMDRTEENLKKYAAVICRTCQEENLRHLKSDALAKIMEHSSRLSGNQDKLSTMFRDIADIIREANFWAEQDKSSLIEARHIRRAIEQKVYRSNLIQQRINEMIDKGVLMIDTEGEKVGQVNGLEVLDLGDFAFGKPTRITTSLGVGREGLIDIEREAKLGGRIHSKGVMILSGYIADNYAREMPLSLAARLVFEQSYEEVEGDSASSTELYAILSRLADVPLKQNIAVTGSVNQKGEIQAIGGVNEKIEGFFEVCQAKGLNGDQGALIPEANVKNLALKEEVAEAVKAGKFHIYPVRTIAEGMEVLSTEKMGQRQADGTYEPGTINDRVQRRLTELAQKLKDFARLEEKKDRKNDES
jgi:lon-related putative ATP-dependent protease